MYCKHSVPVCCDVALGGVYTGATSDILSTLYSLAQPRIITHSLTSLLSHSFSTISFSD
jgi:hypothetical protein